MVVSFKMAVNLYQYQYELPVVRQQSENMGEEGGGGHPQLQTYSFSYTFLTNIHMKKFLTKSDNKSIKGRGGEIFKVKKKY